MAPAALMSDGDSRGDDVSSFHLLGDTEILHEGSSECDEQFEWWHEPHRTPAIAGAMKDNGTACRPHASASIGATRDSSLGASIDTRVSADVASNAMVCMQRRCRCARAMKAIPETGRIWPTRHDEHCRSDNAPQSGSAHGISVATPNKVGRVKFKVLECSSKWFGRDVLQIGCTSRHRHLRNVDGRQVHDWFPKGAIDKCTE